VTIEAIDYQAYPVLYVDDEVDNLRTFELAFRRDFRVVRATDGREALEVLATQPIAIVLSDHRMPGMTGTELLSRVREMAPKTVRLLVTAYGDAATLARAINDGCIYRYIAKPWDVREMREVVRQAIELYALEEQRENLVKELQGLHHATRALGRILDIRPLIDGALEAVVDDFGFDGAMLMAKSPDRAGFRLEGCHPAMPEADELLGVDFALAGLADSLFEGAPVRLDVGRAIDTGGDVRTLASSIAAEEFLFVPMMGRSGMSGVLVVDNRRGGRKFGPSEIQLLGSLGAQVGICLENAEMVGRLRNEAARTSGADALSVEGALGLTVTREIELPFLNLIDAGRSSSVRAELGELARTVSFVSDLLREQTPEHCELGEHVARALEGTRALARGRGAEVAVEASGFPKVNALPGRMLQLLLHVLELALSRCENGRVVIKNGSTEEDAVVEFHLTCAGDGSDETGAEDNDASLLLGACEALARELGASVELNLSARTGRWRISVPRYQ